jgi:hypothetical protein
VGWLPIYQIKDHQEKTDTEERHDNGADDKGLRLNASKILTLDDKADFTQGPFPRWRHKLSLTGHLPVLRSGNMKISAPQFMAEKQRHLGRIIA